MSGTGIQISTPFDLNVAVALDSRIVATNTTTRDLIASGVRYDGLFVYCIADQTTFQLQGGITNSDWKVWGGSSLPTGAQGTFLINNPANTPIFTTINEAFIDYSTPLVPVYTIGNYGSATIGFAYDSVENGVEASLYMAGGSHGSIYLQRFQSGISSQGLELSNNRTELSSNGFDIKLTTDQILNFTANSVVFNTRNIHIGSDYIFPASDGSVGQNLQTDGAGNLSWSMPSLPQHYVPFGDASNKMTSDVTFQFNTITGIILNGGGAGDFHIGLNGRLTNLEGNQLGLGTLGVANSNIGIMSERWNTGNTTSVGNLFVGASVQLVSGDYNTFSGNLSAIGFTIGSRNCFYGASSGSAINGTGGVGSSNCGFGVSTGDWLQSASYLALFGDQAGSRITDANGVVAVGASAGIDLTVGSYNTFAGYHAGVGATTATYNSILGASISCNAGVNYSVGIGALFTVDDSNIFIVGGATTSLISKWRIANINYIMPTSQGTAGQALAISSVTSGVATLAWTLVPSVVGNDRKTGQAAAVNLATVTVPSTDTTYLISANVNITAVAVASFTVTCTYTDETNASRTLTLNFSQISGTLVQTLTAALGAGAYEGVPLQIRAKAGTAIIIGSAAGGTYTSVTYNIESRIQQL